MSSPQFQSLYDLLRTASSGKCSPIEFQRQIEAALYALPITGKRVDQDLRDFVNRVELIVYTIPEATQRQAILQICEEIERYVRALPQEK
jgi:hypothetical protein